jgi:hypothetical protein
MPSKIQLVAHPPERGRRSTSLAAAGSCCCCCCCLHSLGGVVGAIVGGAKGLRTTVPAGIPTPEVEKIKDQVRSASLHTVKVYWLSLLILGILTCIVGVLEAGSTNPGAGVGGSLIAIALCLPAGQLVASVMTLIYLNVFPHPRKADSLRRLGKITLFAFIGGLIGTGLMAATIPFFK